MTERQLGIYLAQDIHYLEGMSKNLRRLGHQFSDRKTKSLLKKHSDDTLATCFGMRKVLRLTPALREIASDPLRPTTYAYLNHQRRNVKRGVRAGLWSLIPCYLFYPTFVKEIRKCEPKSPFLVSWIKELPEYGEAILWKDQIEELFFAVNRTDRKTKVEDVFTISAHYELKFLDMALDEEPWLLGSLPGKV